MLNGNKLSERYFSVIYMIEIYCRDIYCSSIVKGHKSLFGVFELFIYSKSTIKELSVDPSLKFLRQLEVGEKKSMTSYFFGFP